MDKDISNMMDKFSDMIGSSNSSTNSDKSINNNAFDFSKVSPDALNNFAQLLQGNSNNSNNSSNFDMNTILKLKSVMDKMNSNSDPRSNLLRSLKPYLKESRQSKVDQYINLFSMSKVMEAFRETGGNAK